MTIKENMMRIKKTCSNLKIMTLICPRPSLLAVLIGLFMVTIGRADNANKPEENAGPTVSEASVSPLPTLTGGMAFNAAFSPGTQTYAPIVNPIVLMPLGSRLLFETEFNFNSDLTRDTGVWNPRRLNREIEYMQLDYMVHPNLTLVVGRILTPFGIYLERYHPEWIRDLQVAPIIFGISHSQSMGTELRGAVHLTSKVDLTYTGFYAFNSTTNYFTGDRGAGGRTSLFLPEKGVELGFSYNRRLGDQRFNLYGIDGTWNLKSIALDLRSEVFKTGMLGTGYWIEGAYGLKKLSRNSFLSKSQVVLRGEQYLAPNQAAMDTMAGVMMGDNFLPDRNTSRGFAGWNYYVSDAVKCSFAFGRSFATGQNQNIYSAGVTYRFATGGSQK
jgi:hypothetical protein